MEPDRLTRATYLPAALTLARAGVRSTVKSWQGRMMGVLVLVAAVATYGLLSHTWGLAVIWLSVAAAAVIVTIGSLTIPGWNMTRPDRRAWVDAGGRAFVTARLAPPKVYPDNASARHPRRLEAKPLLDRMMAYADANEWTAYWTAGDEEVAQVYIDRYGAEIIGWTWGHRPKMRRCPHASPSPAAAGRQP